MHGMARRAVLACTVLILGLMDFSAAGQGPRLDKCSAGMPEKVKARTIKVTLPNSDVLNELKGKQFCEFFLRYLCGNRNWRVTKRLGALEAEPRSIDTSLNLKMNAAVRQIHLTILFGQQDRTVPSEKELLEQTTFIKPGVSSTQVQEIKEEVEGQTYDHRLTLVVPGLLGSGSGVRITMYEWSRQAGIECIPKALQAVVSEVKYARSVYIGKKPWVWKNILPVGSVQDHPSIIIQADNETGIYTVNGYINPRERGYITLRTFNSENGVEIGEGSDDRTIEYVGWSSDRSENFFFQQKLTLNYDIATGTKDSHRGPVRVEVWFHPVVERKMLQGDIKDAHSWIR